MSYARKCQIHWVEGSRGLFDFLPKTIFKTLYCSLTDRMNFFSNQKSESWTSEFKSMLSTRYKHLYKITKRMSRKHSSKDLQTEFQCELKLNTSVFKTFWAYKPPRPSPNHRNSLGPLPPGPQLSYEKLSSTKHSNSRTFQTGHATSRTS